LTTRTGTVKPGGGLFQIPFCRFAIQSIFFTSDSIFHRRNAALLSCPSRLAITESKTHGFSVATSKKSARQPKSLSLSLKTVDKVVPVSDLESGSDPTARLFGVLNSKSEPDRLIPFIHGISRPLQPTSRQKRNEEILLAMDGTSHSEISNMGNLNAFYEIVTDAAVVFCPTKLEERKSNEGEFLSEAEFQVDKLLRYGEHLNAHATMFLVHFYIGIGQLLNIVEDHLRDTLNRSKQDVVRWRQSTFGYYKTRSLQQFQQLAHIDDAHAYASLGKNRILRLWSIRNHFPGEQFTSLREILTKVKILGLSPPDTTQDDQGRQFNKYIDCVITIVVFQQVEFPIILPDDADLVSLLVCYTGTYIGDTAARSLKNDLSERSKTATKSSQRKCFEEYVFNKGTWPATEGKARSPDSFNKLLVDFVDYCESFDFSDTQTTEEHIRWLDTDTLDKARDAINTLYKKKRAL